MRYALLVAFAAPALSAPALKPKPLNDKQRIVGIWAPDADAKPGGVQGYTFEFRADGTCSRRKGRHEFPGKYDLDASATPRVFAWILDGGFPSARCRYVLDGDRLTFGIYAGEEPPKDFEPGSYRAMYYLKRVKK